MLLDSFIVWVCFLAVSSLGVLRRGFCAESGAPGVPYRECYGAAALRLQYVYSVSAVRLRRVRTA